MICTGAALVLLCTAPWGIGLSPDSATYLNVAQRLLEGRGFTHFDGNAYALWTPLYPLTLAAIQSLGIEPQAFLRWQNSLLFALLIAVSARLFLRHTTSRLVACVCTAAVALSLPLLESHVHAWVDPLFDLLILLAALALARYLSNERWRPLLLSSLLFAASGLQRYAALPFIGAGGLCVVLWGSTSLAGRLRRAAAFVLISVLPVGSWILRNLLLTGTFTGPRWRTEYDPFTALENFASAASVWFLPSALPLWLRLGGMLALAAAGLSALLWTRKARIGAKHGAPKLWRPMLRVSAMLTSAWIVFLVFVASAWNFDPIPQRYIASVYVFVLLLIGVGIDKLRQWQPRLRGVGVLFALWLFYPAAWTLRYVQEWRHDGIGYNSRRWHDNETLAWLREHSPSGHVYSNEVSPILLFTNVEPRIVPLRHFSFPKEFETDTRQRPTLLVWFEPHWWTDQYDLDELSQKVSLETLEVFPDAKVLTMSWRQP